MRDTCIGLVSGIGVLALAGHVLGLRGLTTWGGVPEARVVTALGLVLLALELATMARPLWLGWLGCAWWCCSGRCSSGHQ